MRRRCRVDGGGGEGSESTEGGTSDLRLVVDDGCSEDVGGLTVELRGEETNGSFRDEGSGVLVS